VSGLGRIPENKLEEIRQAADIVEVISRRVPLKQAGRTLKGVCPFHGDKDPSFTVNRERGTWHCFGCGAGGNVFGFVMRDEGLSFPEAVRELARRYGVEMPTRELTPAQRREKEKKESLLRVLHLAGKYFNSALQGPPGGAAREYLLKQRGLNPETVADFALGYAPEGWENLGRYLAQQGISPELAVEAGVMAPSRRGGGAYDRFRERIIFPIRDLTGRVVSFGGRVLGSGEPKYLNGPETPVFRKSRTLYNLNQARRHIRKLNRALVVEGYFDVITLAAHDFGETVAPMGTALTPEQVRLLKGQGRDVVLVFDGDEAGLRAAERALPTFLGENQPARACVLPAGEDPDTMVRNQGPQAFAELLDTAPPLAEVVLERIAARGELGTPEGKSACASEMGAVLKAMRDPVMSWEYLGRAARILNLPPEVLAARLGLKTGFAQASPPPVPARSPQPAANDPTQRHIIQLAFSGEQACRLLAEGGAFELISDPRLKTVVEALQSLLGAGVEPEPARVMQMLQDDPGLQEMLSALCAAPLELDTANMVKEVNSVLAQLADRALRRELAQLTQELARADQAGDLETVARLQARRKELRSVNLNPTVEKD
jgi:DNA primase